MSSSDFYGIQSSTTVGIESTFGTAAPSPLRAAMTGEGFAIERTRQVEKVNDERTRAFAHVDPILGPKSATCKMPLHVRPASSQYDTAATPATHYLQQVMKGLMGGHVGNAGAVTKNSSTASNIDTTTGGHGLRFTEGQTIGVEVGGALEWTRITAISTDALSIKPSLSTTPTTGGVIINGDFFYLTPTNTQSLTFAHAKINDSNFSWQLVGCTGDLEFALDANKLVTCTADLKSPNWTFTSAAGQSPAVAVTAFTETLAAQMLGFQTICWFQAVSTTTRVHVPVEVGGFSMKMNLGNEHIMEQGGSIQNAVGVIRKPMRPAATVTIKLRADTAYETAFTARTAYSLFMIVPSGSGTTARAISFAFPNVRICAQPEYSGDRMVVTLQLECFEPSDMSAVVTNPAMSPVAITLL